MRTSRLAPLLIALALAAGVACQRGAGTARTAISSSPSPSPSSASDPGPSPSQSPLDLLPAPDEPFPTNPVELAARIRETTDRLGAAIGAWVSSGDPSAGQPPQDVVLLALYQQRMYRYLVRHSGLADRTIAELDKPTARAARDIVTAGHELYSLVRGHAVKSATTFKVQVPEPAGVLLGYFKRAAQRVH